MTRTWIGEGWFLSCHVGHALVAVQVVAICVCHVYRGHKCISWFIKAMCGSRGGGGRGFWTISPEKSQKYRVSLQYWSGYPEKSQSYMYQASIQCWAIIGPPAKRHLNGVSLADRWWPAFLEVFGSSLPSSTKKKTLSKLDTLWQNLLDPRMCTVGIRCK